MGQLQIGTSGGTHAWVSVAVATALAAASGIDGAVGSKKNRGSVSRTVISKAIRCAG